ncbi:hypothetical protein R3I94_002516 [Phoxinus phoxinus]|uniref:Uncharacterized protein n=1 Tax=Phoxinus phoxinus TaxID=58324 RepID=A0AAN9DMR6_9TELE
MSGPRSWRLSSVRGFKMELMFRCSLRMSDGNTTGLDRSVEISGYDTALGCVDAGCSDCRYWITVLSCAMFPSEGSVHWL